MFDSTLATFDSPTRTVTKCIVCGCTEVHTDEVKDRGWVLLSECPRCEHRWTAQAEPPMRRNVIPVHQPNRRSREVASAA